MKKKLYIFILLLIFINTNAITKNSIFIVATINDNILTNLDIEKEVSYLKILNPQLEKLSNKQVFNIAKNSLINEMIKKNEAKKFFKFNKNIKTINNLYFSKIILFQKNKFR